MKNQFRFLKISHFTMTHFRKEITKYGQFYQKHNYADIKRDLCASKFCMTNLELQEVFIGIWDTTNKNKSLALEFDDDLHYGITHCIKISI